MRHVSNLQRSVWTHRPIVFVSWQWVWAICFRSILKGCALIKTVTVWNGIPSISMQAHPNTNPLFFCNLILVGFVEKVTKIEVLLSQVEVTMDAVVTHYTDTQEAFATKATARYTTVTQSSLWGVCYTLCYTQGYINCPQFIKKAIWEKRELCSNISIASVHHDAFSEEKWRCFQCGLLISCSPWP